MGASRTVTDNLPRVSLSLGVRRRHLVFRLVGYSEIMATRSHPGNRLVRCGIITLSLFLVMGLSAWKVPSFPIWNLGPLLFLLCLLTMFFLLQRAYLAFRGRMKTRDL